MEPHHPVKSLMGDVLLISEKMDLWAIAAQAQRIVDLVAKGYNIDELERCLTALKERLEDELGRKYFFYLEPKDAALYSNERPFGLRVFDGFPSIEHDALESARCLALGRTTASVFHSIRCLEAGIRALSHCIGLDPTKPSMRDWGSMLSELRGAIAAEWSAQSRQHGDGKLFEELHASLASIKNPWRNATMHLDQKYTKEEAEHRHEMVKGFMRQLSERMDEAGQPTVADVKFVS